MTQGERVTNGSIAIIELKFQSKRRWRARLTRERHGIDGDGKAIGLTDSDVEAQTEPQSDDKTSKDDTV
jgi:hypothetical protein